MSKFLVMYLKEKQLFFAKKEFIWLTSTALKN